MPYREEVHNNVAYSRYILCAKMAPCFLQQTMNTTFLACILYHAYLVTIQLFESLLEA